MEKIDFTLTSRDIAQYVRGSKLIDPLLRYRDYPLAEQYWPGQPVSIQDDNGIWIGEVARRTRSGIVIDVT